MNEIRIYRVGGCVRDAIMGVRPHDIDYAVEARSFDAMRNFIVANGGRIWQERPEFVTIRAQVGGEDADFVLCRSDGVYSDGRHPDTVEIGSIYDDLRRRDFTMNAIAWNPIDGTYIDPHGGMDDIRERVIRCVGSANDRIREDYLRLVRAARFSITKDMIIDRAISAMFEDDDVLQHLTEDISRERVREEIAKMFAFDTVRSIRFFGNYSAFAAACFGDDIWMEPTMKGRSRR